MPRGTRTPSEVFSSVLSKAAKQLLLDALKAADFEQKGIKGNERASALAGFLREHLPKRFALSKGEAIDYRDNRTGSSTSWCTINTLCIPAGRESKTFPSHPQRGHLLAGALSRCFREP